MVAGARDARQGATSVVSFGKKRGITQQSTKGPEPWPRAMGAARACKIRAGRERRARDRDERKEQSRAGAEGDGRGKLRRAGDQRTQQGEWEGEEGRRACVEEETPENGSAVKIREGEGGWEIG